MGGNKSTEREGWKILAFGDSLTKGYYNYGMKYHPYSTTLAKLLQSQGSVEVRIKEGLYLLTKQKIETAGVNGEVTSRMLERLPEELLDKHFDVVIILGGTNDLGWVTQETIAKIIKKLHEMAHKAGSKSLMVTIPSAVSVCGQLLFIFLIQWTLQVPEDILEKRMNVNKLLR